jgi:hypothetical protein
MSVQHHWNDEMGKAKYSGNTMSQYHFVYHKSLMLAWEESCTSAVKGFQLVLELLGRST